MPAVAHDLVVAWQRCRCREDCPPFSWEGILVVVGGVGGGLNFINFVHQYTWPCATQENELVGDMDLEESSGNAEHTEDPCKDEKIQLQAKLKLLEESAALFQKERNYLRNELITMKKEQRKLFTLTQSRNSNDEITFYTGFPSVTVLTLCLDYLDPGQNGKNIKYCNSVDNPKVQRQRKLLIEDEFFMIRLRLGTFDQQLAHTFGVSQASVTRICKSWINFMYLQFGSINIRPSDEIIKKTMRKSTQKIMLP